MRITFTNATDYPLSILANLFNDAFEGYIGGEVQFTALSFARFLAQENIDLGLSDLAVQSGEPVGFALIARIGWTTRLAAMGVAQKNQGQGVGKLLLAHSFEQSCKRGDKLYTLECIEQNERGVRLYQGAGLITVRRLLSYHRTTSKQSSTPQAKDQAAVTEIKKVDISTVARLVAYHGTPDLPWQVAGYELARFGPPYIAVNLGPAYAVLSSPEQDKIVLRNFFVLPEERSQGHGRRLMDALTLRYPQKSWLVPAVCPEEYGGFFQHTGFEPDQLSQFQMEKTCR